MYISLQFYQFFPSLHVFILSFLSFFDVTIRSKPKKNISTVTTTLNFEIALTVYYGSGSKQYASLNPMKG